VSSFSGLVLKFGQKLIQVLSVEFFRVGSEIWSET
jgi:hypothetical protein